MSDRPSLADRIDGVRFRPVMLRGGYEMAEIDTMLDEMSRRAAADQPLSPALPRTPPRIVRIRAAYSIDEVHTFLVEVLAERGERAPDWLTR